MTREQYTVASLEQSYKSLKDAYSALAGCSSDPIIKNLRAEIEALENKVRAEYVERYNELNYAQRRTIGAKIREARIKSGKTIEEVAEFMNFRTQTIQNIENGRFSVKLDVAEKMLNYCGYELSVEPIR